MQPLLPSTIHCQAAQRKNIPFPPVGKRHFFQPTPNPTHWCLLLTGYLLCPFSDAAGFILKEHFVEGRLIYQLQIRKHIYLSRQIFLYHSKTWIFGGDSLTNNHLGWRVLGLLWLSSCFYQQPQLARPSLTHRSLSERAIFFAGAWHVTRFGGV